jgi:hypothetical protein
MMYKICLNNFVNKYKHKAHTLKQGRPAVFDLICNSQDFLALSNWMLANNGLERI